MTKPEPTESLDSLLSEAEQEVKQVESASNQADQAILREIETIEGTNTRNQLELQRDVLNEELDLTRKLESELWNGAHIACLPFFYETYTIQAQIETKLQDTYNQATIAACSRFKALGKNGLAMVSPIIDFIRNYASYTKKDRSDLDTEVQKRILTWLREDIMPEARPKPVLTRSLEQIVTDITEAEQVFMRNTPEAVYMEGELQIAAVKAIRTSQFLPSLVKIRLLQALHTLSASEIRDIGNFLLWETRKSSHHQNMLLYTLLQLFKSLNKSLI